MYVFFERVKCPSPTCWILDRNIFVDGGGLNCKVEGKAKKAAYLDHFWYGKRDGSPSFGGSLRERESFELLLIQFAKCCNFKYKIFWKNFICSHPFGTRSVAHYF